VDAEQRPGVVVAVRLLQAALVFQERGGLCVKNTEKALNAASTIVQDLFLPLRGSTKVSKVRRICRAMPSKVRA
jgi:hypothetical protein